MAVTVTTTNYASINTCQNAGDWTGESPLAITDFFKEGTGCMQFTFRGVGNNDSYITGTWDLSGTKHFRWWFMTTAVKELNTFAGGGVQLYMSDGSSTGYWKISGSDTYPGGWLNMCLDLSRAVDTGTKPTMTAITTIGFRLNHIANAKNSPNTWIDFLHYNDGLVCYGDLSGSPFSFADILSADENTTNGWGIIRKISGVYYLVGSLTFGDSAGTNSCDFEDLSQDIVFEDRLVNASLYEIEVVGNGTGTTEFILGATSGGRGISGCFVHTEDVTQTPKFAVTCTDTDVGTFKIYGTTFLDAGIVSLPLTGANREVLSSSFERCGEAIASTCKVQYCNFVSADDVGMQIASTSHNVTDGNFIQCGHGIEFTSVGTYSLSDVSFSGSDGSSYYDIENSNNGTTCDSYTGTRDGDVTLNDTTIKTGQSFTGDGGTLGHCYFTLSKANTPTGNAVATVYAHTGTFGTDGTPTGAVLATSQTFDVSSLDGTPTLTKFVFPVADQVTLTNAVKYFVCLEYNNGTSSNTVLVARDLGGAHGGNVANYVSSWTADNTMDLLFFVRTGGIVNVNATGASNPSQSYVDDTGTPEGTTAVANTKTLTVTCKNEAGSVLQDVNIRIETSPGGVLISEGTTNASGVYSDATYNYGGDVDVKVIARIKGKVNNKAFDAITVDGLSIPFTMIKDRSVNLP